MKIKKEKEFTLPQLIEWAMANDVRVRKFRSKNGYCVCFDRNGFIYFDNSRIIPLDQTFTVEVEEEITEHTVFPKLVTRNTSGRYNGWISECVKGFHLELIEAIYILNDDLTMTLIWTKEKGLVG